MISVEDFAALWNPLVAGLRKKVRCSHLAEDAAMHAVVRIWERSRLGEPWHEKTRLAARAAWNQALNLLESRLLLVAVESVDFHEERGPESWFESQRIVDLLAEIGARLSPHDRETLVLLHADATPTEIAAFRRLTVRAVRLSIDRVREATKAVLAADRE